MVWRVSSQAIASHFLQDSQGAQGNVFEVADGSGDHVEAARASVIGLRLGHEMVRASAGADGGSLTHRALSGFGRYIHRAQPRGGRDANSRFAGGLKRVTIF